MGWFDWFSVLFKRRPPHVEVPTRWSIGVLVCDANGRPVAGALVRMHGNAFVGTTDAGGWVRFVDFPVRETTLHVSKAGYRPYGESLAGVRALSGKAQNICIGTQGSATDLMLPPFRQDRLLPGENGRLLVRGRQFVTEDGRPWRYRGVSMFLLPHRFYRGENISPQLEWMLARGFNTARCWLDIPAGFKGERYGFPHPSAFRPDSGWVVGSPNPEFSGKLHAFFSLLAQSGIRVEFTVLTYATDMTDMRARVQSMYDIAQSHWNVIVEGGNEVENQGIDIVDVMRGVERYGVLSTYGNDPARHCDHLSGQPGWHQCMIDEVPHLDYGTTHDLHRSFEKSPRVTKDAREYSDVYHIPFVNDEPIGYIDPGHPYFVPHGPDPQGWMTFGGLGGGGARTSNPDVIVSAAAIAYLLTGGYTYHPQCGLEGRRPSADEPLQDACAVKLGELARFIPVEALTGEYRAPHVADWACEWSEEDSLVGHAYGSAFGGTQIVVNPMPRQGWQFVGANGWRLAAICPAVPYVARFVR